MSRASGKAVVLLVGGACAVAVPIMLMFPQIAKVERIPNYEPTKGKVNSMWKQMDDKIKGEK